MLEKSMRRIDGSGYNVSGSSIAVNTFKLRGLPKSLTYNPDLETWMGIPVSSRSPMVIRVRIVVIQMDNPQRVS